MYCDFKKVFNNKQFLISVNIFRDVKVIAIKKKKPAKLNIREKITVYIKYDLKFPIPFILFAYFLGI